MAKSYPKHVRKRSKNSLQYRRKLQGIGGEFSHAMACNQDSPESDIQREAIHITRLYELELKTKAATSPDFLTDMDTDAAALELLRQLSKRDGYKYQAGDLHPPKFDEVEREYGIIVKEPASEFLADEIVGIENLMHETQGREPTVDEQVKLKVMFKAKEALLKPRKRPPRYLSQVLDWYCTNRKNSPDWPMEGREYTRRKNRFLEILTHIGDCPTEDSDAAKRIVAGLEAYAEHRVNTSKVKGQSINRDIRGSLSAFRRVSKVYKLGWTIEAPEVEENPIAEREVLTDEEQIALVKWCLATNDKFAAILLAQLHAGLMATEVLRLAHDPEESMVFEGSLPYLLIKEATKKETRKRLVPLVLGVDVMRENLAKGVAWLNSTTESNHSHTLKKRLLKATSNPRITAHCLRHTWNNNASAMDISVLHRALIGGWAATGKDSQFSPHMLKYGRSGLQRTKTVQALADSQRQVFAHLLHIEPPAKGNVINISSRAE